MRHRTHDIGFGVLVALALALGVFVVLVWSGHFVAKDAGAPPATRPPQAPATTAAAPPPPPPVATRPQAAPPLARVTLVAARGDCWVSAHARAFDGPVLLERVVTQGESVTVRGRKIWLQLGAAANVDLSVNGRPRTVSAGTTTLVLG